MEKKMTGFNQILNGHQYVESVVGPQRIAQVEELMKTAWRSRKRSQDYQIAMYIAKAKAGRLKMEE